MAQVTTSEAAFNFDSPAELPSGRYYVQISEEAFDDFMEEELYAKYTKHVPAGSKEVAYDIPTPHDDLVIRVFSTIYRGVSRDKDRDSIKAVVYDTSAGRLIDGRTKTLRIGPTASNPRGWKGNLRPKILDLIKNWRRRNRLCENCGRRMHVVEPGRNDDWPAFWGCPAEWCDYTEETDD
jgi:hypothetical protein